MTNVVPIALRELPVDAMPFRDFFLARQPILDRQQELFAYELLFRAAAAGPANVTNDLHATASVIAHASELGMPNVVGNSLAFINIDADVLFGDFIHLLPKDKVILEILETVEASERIVRRVEELVKRGFTFALDDVVADSPNVHKLLPLVDIIKIDIAGLNDAELATLAKRFKQGNKRLLAEKVENVKQFEHCMVLGFDYFQGYYFAKPTVLTGKRLTPSQVAIMQLIARLASNAELEDIERSIKLDPSLGLSLLRLVNAPSTRIDTRIDSVGAALRAVGRTQIQQWLQILLYAECDKAKVAVAPLLTLASARGRLLELIAQVIHPGDNDVAGTAFTVGVMSLMDTLFGMPMQEIVLEVSIAPDVSDALISRSGLYGDMLKLAECIEQIDVSCPYLAPLLDKLHLSTEQLYAMQLLAYEWSNSVSQSA